MNGKHPRPVRDGDKWVVDLRSHGFAGWRYVLGPGTLSELEAVHAAYARLEELRDARLSAPGAQLELRPGAPRTLAAAIDEWERRKRYATPDGAEYGKKIAKALRAELGARQLAELDGIAGADELLGYLHRLESLGARTVRNRFSVLLQVLRLAGERRWIASVPTPPDLPSRPAPRFEWIDEPTFRAMLAGVHLVRSAAVAPGESMQIHTARRRVYLSWLFYTGAHRRDADLLDDSHVSLDTGFYLRHNSKSARCVPDEQFEMAEPLIDDLRALLQVLGREAFYCGEKIGGGPWPKVDHVLGRAQRQLGIPGAGVNTRILRRSFAREMLRRGYSVEEVADRMGHVNTTMVREVYTRMPRPPGSARSRWTRSRPGWGPPPAKHIGARVVPFRRPAEEGDHA